MPKSIDVGTRFVDKWAPKFGFSDWHRTLRPMPAKGLKTAWAACKFHADELWYQMWLPPDGHLPPEQVEACVVHEMAHGLFTLAKACDDMEEQAANRVTRLLLPNPKLAGEWKYDQHGQKDKSTASREDLELVLPYLVDALPEDELKVINALYYERVGLGAIGRELGMSKSAVRHVRNRALKRMRLVIDELAKN